MNRQVVVFFLSCGLISSQLPPAFITKQTLIVGAQSDKCLNPLNRSLKNGVPIVINTCSSEKDSSQAWIFRPIKSGIFMIMNSKSKLCLKASAKEKASNVIQNSCKKEAFQLWSISQAGSKNWKIQMLTSSLGFDVSGLQTSENTPLHVYWYKKASNQHFQFVQSSAVSKGPWTDPVLLPLVPMAGANLADGRVLFWSSALRNGYGLGLPFSHTHIATYNIFTGNIVDEIIPIAADIFCPGTVMLANGSLMIAGGISSGKTTIFNGTSWTAGSKLKVGRGYNTVTLLPDGRAFTIGGSWSGGVGHKFGELWTPATGWKKLSNLLPKQMLTHDKAGAYRADNHMWLVGYPGGWVFQAGPSKTMHWINTAGKGSIVAAGLRADDGDAMNGNAVVFQAGQILAVGGAPSYEGATPTNSAFVTDYSRGPRFPSKARRIRGMAFARAFHNSVLLPNGHVVVIGGQGTRTEIFSDSNAVLTPEIWNPAIQKFAKLAPMKNARNYHSIALLLLDGRVLSAGGGGCGDSCADNHANFEILTPPYLQGSRKRPIITWTPKVAAMGSTIWTTAFSASTFVMVRMSTVTHATNSDQRRFKLQSSTKSGKWRLKIPTMADGVIPGNYMLFAMNSVGTPSIARVVLITQNK